MRIFGEWRELDDGVTRPMVRAHVAGSGAILASEYFLVDTGADRSTFSAALLDSLQIQTSPPPPGLSLVGIGGAGAYVLVETAIIFRHDGGGPVRMRGIYAAFTDPRAIDMSILGRDVLDYFDVIVSKPRNEVLLLSQSHQYRVVRA
jgi:Aspartyl protease